MSYRLIEEVTTPTGTAYAVAIDDHCVVPLFRGKEGEWTPMSWIPLTLIPSIMRAGHVLAAEEEAFRHAVNG